MSKMILGASAGCMAIALTAPSFAQEASRASGTHADAPASGGGIEEILVTARRTNESLQSTPVAISAFNDDFLQSQNVQQFSKLAQFTPNLYVNEQPSSVSAASYFIRGIGQSDPNIIGETGVGLYFDGVYIARTSGILMDLVDPERIEVLRGPQGTLFGRNTTGGAIQIVTKKPSDDFGVNLRGGIESFDGWKARAVINTGYIAGSPFKVTLAYQHRQNDGYVNNILAPGDKDPGSLNSDAVWIRAHGDLSDNFTVDYTFDYNSRVGGAPFLQMVSALPNVVTYFSRSPQFGGAPFQISPDRLDPVQQAGYPDRSGNPRLTSIARNEGHALTFELSLGEAASIKSITAYRKFFQDTHMSLSGQGPLRGEVYDPVSRTVSVQDVVPINGNNSPQRQRQWSQELQLFGTVGEFSYLLGGYFFREKGSESLRQTITAVVPGARFGLPQDLVGVMARPQLRFAGTSKSYAGFGQLRWNPAAFDGRLEIAGGLRYTHDKKTFEQVRVNPNTNFSGSKSFSNTSWLASASYKFTPEMLGYIRVSTAYKAGGFNARASGFLNSFDPEKVIAYEAGLKTEWFDNRLRANIAVFQTDYDDLQVTQFLSGTSGSNSQIVNAGKARIRGVEIELLAKPVDRLTLDASYGYSDPKYREFLFLDPKTNQVENIASEARFGQVAKTNYRIGAQYDFPQGQLGYVSARVDWAWRGELSFAANPRLIVLPQELVSDPQGTLSARLALKEIPVGGRAKAEVALWGDNLLNDENISFGIDFGSLNFANGVFRKPRTIGLDVSIQY